MAKHPKAELRVYAVWFNMVWRDSRARWRSDLLTDPRVTHFWDERRETGRWFLDEVTRREGAQVEWDAYFVYPPSARWDAAPAPLTGWGRTVLGNQEGLRRALLPLLEIPPKPSP